MYVEVSFQLQFKNHTFNPRLTGSVDAEPIDPEDHLLL